MYAAQGVLFCRVPEGVDKGWGAPRERSVAPGRNNVLVA